MTDYKESFARQDREVRNMIDAWLARIAWVVLPILIGWDVWRMI